jgi:hypothetical protein
MQTFIKLIRQALCSLTLLGLAAQANADTQFHVVLDTTSIAGSGWLAASAMLSQFQGALAAGDAQVSGAVTGLLGGNVQFGNSTSYNDLFQSVRFGQVISFDVTFSGAFLSTPSNIGTSFGLALYAADQSTVLGNGNAASGSLLSFELLAPTALGQFGSVTPVIYDAGLISVSSVSAVPEPSEWAMMVAGLAALGVMAQRRRKQGTMIG